MKRTIINGPPSDMRCECCGKSLDELKPFEKTGDFFDDLFLDEGEVKLFKNYRDMLPPNIELEKIKAELLEDFNPVLGFDDVKKRLIENYGEKKAENLIERMAYDSLLESGPNCIGASWECRDCVGINHVGYWEKRFESRNST